MNWLDDLLKQTEEFEAPERYYWWSGLAAISAVTRKNVWLDKFSYNLYLNIYVALISTHSGARKGEPIRVCKNLLQEVNLTRVISGNNSIQGIIEELGKQKSLGNGTVISEAHGILLSSEFSSFFIDDPKSLDCLTELYGTHEHEKEWVKTLKSSQVTLKSPCITMLVASNESMLDSIVKRKEIEGGFIGRVMMVKESGVKRLNSLIRPPKSRLNIPELAVRLVEISKIKGQFKLTEQSIDMYEEWYYRTFGEDHDDRTGTYNRLGDHVLKTAMLISLSRKDDLTLEWKDLQLAIDKCEECVDAAIRITPNSELNNGDRANVMKLLGNCLVDAALSGKPISKMAILNKLSKWQVTTTTVDFYLEELIKLDRISKKILMGPGHINTRTFYSLTEEGREFLGWKAKRTRVP